MQAIIKYSVPLMNIGIGLGFILLARKAEVSNNPIFRNSITINFLIESSKVFGIITTLKGMDQFCNL